MIWVRSSRSVRAGGIAVLLLVAQPGFAESWGDYARSKGYDNASLLVSGQEVGNHLGDPRVRIVDVRPFARYTAGHIPGAVSLPIAEITRSVDGVPGMLAPIGHVERALGARGITPRSQLIIYDEVGGNRATRLFWVLDFLGHPRLSVLDSGFDGWRRAGRPVERLAPPAEPARYRGTVDSRKLADSSWVEARLADPSVVLLDTRSPGEYEGRVAGRDVVRPGHIPGAVHVDWVQNLTETEPRRFRSGEVLARLYRQAGVAPGREILVYCRTGVRASHTYVALRLLGYPRVRLYDGSFVEWSARPRLPVSR